MALHIHCRSAAVIDGHGGLSSAAWLQQHLYEDVVARLDQSFLQPDPAAEEVPGRPAVVKPSKLEQTMIDVFQQADIELLQHLLGELGHCVLMPAVGLVCTACGGSHQHPASGSCLEKQKGTYSSGQQLEYLC